MEYLRAAQIEILITRIDITRKAVHKLFYGLTKDSDDELFDYLLSLVPDLIDGDEFRYLIHNFNVEGIKKILKNKPRNVK